MNSEMPQHTHTMMANALDPADLSAPAATRVLAQSAGVFAYQTSAAGAGQLIPQALPPAGGSLPHNNMQPYLVLNCIIALQGIFPSRN
jgi:microcystin-dependent protein